MVRGICICPWGRYHTFDNCQPMMSEREVTWKCRCAAKFGNSNDLREDRSFESNLRPMSLFDPWRKSFGLLALLILTRDICQRKSQSLPNSPWQWNCSNFVLGGRPDASVDSLKRGPKGHDENHLWLKADILVGHILWVTTSPSWEIWLKGGFEFDPMAPKKSRLQITGNWNTSPATCVWYPYGPSKNFNAGWRR
jgi:hypothetical protein